MAFTIEEVLASQQALWEKHKEEWAPMEPAYGRASLLWLVEELGEVIHIIKKKGDDAIMEDEAVREAFLEEMSDVLMYYADALLRYQVSAEELANAYRKKHVIDLLRDYNKENHDYLKQTEESKK